MKEFLNDHLETTLPLIEGKWRFHIICSLLERPKHFRELQRSVGKISQKVLTENVRSMEKDGLITRHIRKDETNVNVVYRLTQNGYSIISVIDELVRWSIKYKSDI